MRAQRSVAPDRASARGRERRSAARAGAGRRVARAQLAALIRADFAAGRTVELDRWIVSLTEAWLDALAALS